MALSEQKMEAERIELYSRYVNWILSNIKKISCLSSG